MITGYTGDHCEVNINDCLGVQCNNGTCKDLVGDFHCKCYGGYEGKYCDQEINECLSGPCQNGGTCHDLIDDYECRCPRGTSGLLNKILH